MATVINNLELYEFLKEHSMENGVFYDYKRKEIITYTHLWFFQLDEFVSIIGKHHFEEGGIQVQMFEDTICVELNDIIESEGNELEDYKNCFDERSFKDAKNIMEWERKENG